MNKATIDQHYMKIALEAAKKAFESGEVPIGALIVNKGEIMSIGQNMCEQNASQTYHAEMVALDKIKGLTLLDATIYTTHEPCPMCLGAIIESGIKRIVYGAPEPRWGCLGGAVDLQPLFELEVISGVFEEECRDLIKNFFKVRRLACK
ncbi:MAG: nucleoside deaminase [Chlamydiia bacterium]